MLLVLFLTIGSFAEDIRIVKQYQDNSGKQFIELEPSTGMVIEGVTLDNSDNNFTLSYSDIKKSSTIYFLIDSSFPMKKAFKKGINPLIKELYKKKGTQKWIVSRFDINLEMLYNEYASSSSLISKLDAMEIKGQRTELWKNSEKAIDFLKEITNGTKKILVICSDGESEDQAYKIETSIEESLKNGITIISLGYRDKGTKKTNFIQNMERVANDTYGKFWNANKENKFSSSFINDFNSFVTTVSNKNIQIELPKEAIHSTVDGKQKVILRVKSKYETKELAVLVDVPVKKVAKQSFWEKYKYYIIGVTLALLGLLIFLLTRKKAKKEDEPIYYNENTGIKNTIIAGGEQTSFPESTSLEEEKEYIAYFESLGGTKHYIYKFPSTIGSSAEVAIDGEFISREHAFIEFEDGRFFISDRDSKNGLFVNDREVSEEEIWDEDKVSFGPYNTIFKTRGN